MCVLKSSKIRDSTYSHNLHPNGYSQEFHYYPFPVKLDRCVILLYEVVILLMTYLIKYVFQIKQKI